jgi:hypothetical protein
VSGQDHLNGLDRIHWESSGWPGTDWSEDGVFLAGLPVALSVALSVANKATTTAVTVSVAKQPMIINLSKDSLMSCGREPF